MSSILVFLCHAEHLFSSKTVLKFFILSLTTFFDSFKDVLEMLKMRQQFGQKFLKILIASMAHW
jgi:hypothetical protein